MKEPIKITNRGSSTWGNWCRHYNGLYDIRKNKENTCCEAGVNYDSVKEDVEFQIQRRSEVYTQKVARPCFFHEAHLAKPCPKQSFRTDVEIAEHEAEMNKEHQNYVKCRTLITEHSGGKRGVGGFVKCPICATGTIRYSIAGCNGHVHARCSTEGCMAWME